MLSSNLPESIIAFYLTKDLHRAATRNKWGIGNNPLYRHIWTVTGDLLNWSQAVQVSHEPGSNLMPTVCITCMEVIDKLPIPYGKVLPYCHNCYMKCKVEVRHELASYGDMTRDQLMHCLLGYYPCYEVEYFISKVISQGLWQVSSGLTWQKNRKLANPSGNRHNTPLTLRERLQRSRQP